MPRIAITSDIQGNALALEYVLQHISQLGASQIICLGDLVSGPQPTQVLALLRSHQVVCVRGNMDEAILNPTEQGDLKGSEQKFSEIDQWCHAQLTQEDKDYLRALPLTHAFDTGALQGLCFHGAPHSTETIIDTYTPDEELAILLNNVDETILLTGHMHLPMLRVFGDQIIVNPGSVGLPYGGKRRMPLRAEYAVVSADANGFSVAFHQINLDPDWFKHGLLNSGMPHATWYLS